MATKMTPEAAARIQSATAQGHQVQLQKIVVKLNKKIRVAKKFCYL